VGERRRGMGRDDERCRAVREERSPTVREERSPAGRGKRSRVVRKQRGHSVSEQRPRPVEDDRGLVQTELQGGQVEIRAKVARPRIPPVGVLLEGAPDSLAH
jgi:hypothetical protein